MEKQAEIEALMHVYIAKVQSIEWESPCGIMNSYPGGCCTIASYQLGHLLQDRGYGSWRIVNGSAGSMRNHDWLESLEFGLVVDPTAHQFPKLGFTAPFTSEGTSPLEAHFPRKQIVDLDDWSGEMKSIYRRHFGAIVAR